MDQLDSQTEWLRNVRALAGSGQECLQACVERPWGKLAVTPQQKGCLRNCEQKHAALEKLLGKVQTVKASARPLEYYVDASDYTGMQALTGRTNPNDGFDTSLHTNLASLRHHAGAFSDKLS